MQLSFDKDSNGDRHLKQFLIYEDSPSFRELLYSQTLKD